MKLIESNIIDTEFEEKYDIQCTYNIGRRYEGICVSILDNIEYHFVVVNIGEHYQLHFNVFEINTFEKIQLLSKFETMELN